MHMKRKQYSTYLGGEGDNDICIVLVIAEVIVIVNVYYDIVLLRRKVTLEYPL